MFTKLIALTLTILLSVPAYSAPAGVTSEFTEKVNVLLPDSKEAALVLALEMNVSEGDVKEFSEYVDANKIDFTSGDDLFFKDGQFYQGGTRTGVRITSFAPVNITYKGKTWGFDKRRSFTQNYSDLYKLLKGKNQVSLLGLFMDDAQAAPSNAESRAVISGWTGAAAGVLTFAGALVAAGAATVAAPLTAAVVVAIVVGGAVYKTLADNEKRSIAEINSLLNRGTLECNANGIQIHFGSVSNRSSLVIDRRVPVTFRQTDKRGSAYNFMYALPAQKARLDYVLKNCNVGEDAVHVQARLRRLNESLSRISTASITTPVGGVPASR